MRKAAQFHSMLTPSLALTGALLLGCQAAPERAPVAAREAAIVELEGATCVTLYAGQTINAGSVCASVNNTVDTSAQCPGDTATTGALLVTYATTGGWELVEAHLAAGDALADLPVNKSGNPMPGQFPYHSGDITGDTSYTFTVPLCIFVSSGVPLDGALNTCNPVTAYLAAHAALRKPDGSGGYQTETGWGDGQRFVTRGSWAEYFNLKLICTQETPPPPPPVTCETAFAVGTPSDCFLSIDEDNDGNGDFDRWGWSNGPLASGSYTLDLYAGAGQCDVSKGTKVGTLSVNYDVTTVTVTYNMLSGFTLDETHLYVGSGIVPIHCTGPQSNRTCEGTVAPGQYPYIHDELNSAGSDTYTVSASGDIRVIAHAVACGAF